MTKRSFLYYDELETPVGTMTMIRTDEGLCRLDFGSLRDLSSALIPWKKRYFLFGEFKQDPERLEPINTQLREYFDQQRKTFSIPFDLYGTPFQQRVWNVLFSHIPYGETQSYKDVAHKIQSPKAVRAVGGAINKNPIAIIVPCHRVIGSNGSLVGYNGGLNKKEYLLKLENALVKG
ncbi:methylated-DNA--[protein]-cysteine S-methyltransferase [Aquibacillus sp. 3ASR75-11]|uniref:Methylated-DNA--protein-cysteine methyltransferase n=1 Tax=Terrihalobacillus insolitus TaxID=2950438 RepID=A0A9X4ALP5_9BACI|nr:methylated-DNA--[protein]-cysteine S-methyltransferase [Terrihalobacillus insolitus]MDC3413631.1 methylated-DNA--[protein]-cysteine S-methyltransferase [Terrihalobacillus insolitus]MDC3424612.1 methylated-DNA--[protein]-cysteine S-methyltransferase [Terrihalobacillus insolitus]